jgi:hypothetical protein
VNKVTLLFKLKFFVIIFENTNPDSFRSSSAEDDVLPVSLVVDVIELFVFVADADAKQEYLSPVSLCINKLGKLLRI